VTPLSNDVARLPIIVSTWTSQNATSLGDRPPARGGAIMTACPRIRRGGLDVGEVVAVTLSFHT
jgi:hypothetical protein